MHSVPCRLASRLYVTAKLRMNQYLAGMLILDRLINAVASAFMCLQHLWLVSDSDSSELPES